MAIVVVWATLRFCGSGLCAAPARHEEERHGWIGGAPPPRWLSCCFQCEPVFDHGVQVGGEGAVVGADSAAHAVASGVPPALIEVAVPVGQLARMSSMPGKPGWMIDQANQLPGRVVADAVETAPSRSSTSISAMLDTTPSKGMPSHQSVVHASAQR